jgi:glycine/D-amino acid oxidase-like deaminating enzyme
VLDGDVTADICIVGGGLLGLWTAIRIHDLNPSADVVVLEGNTCGFGASGRNAGMAMTLWSKAPSLIKRVGESEARRLAQASEDALQELDDFCGGEGIDCGWTKPGWLWCATAPAQVGSWTSTLQAAEVLNGRPFRVLSAEEARARLRAPLVYGAALEQESGTVNPARLVLGLRAAALRRGVRVFEYSPVWHIDRSSQVVSCPNGIVRSRQLILAINAWLAKLPELRRAMIPISADMIATEAIEDIVADRWPRGEAYTNSRTIVDFARPTADGRIVFGRGGAAISFSAHLGPAFRRNPTRTVELRTALSLLMPVLDGVEVTHSWSGPVDRTPDGLPVAGRLPGSEVLFGGGFSGNGIGPTMLVSRMLAALALRIRNEWSQSSLIGLPGLRFPPEPIRYLGGLLVRRAVRARFEATDAGRPISPLVSRLADLAPGGLVKADQPSRPSGSEKK